MHARLAHAPRWGGLPGAWRSPGAPPYCRAASGGTCLVWEGFAACGREGRELRAGQPQTAAAHTLRCR